LGGAPPRWIGQMRFGGHRPLARGSSDTVALPLCFGKDREITHANGHLQLGRPESNTTPKREQ